MVMIEAMACGTPVVTLRRGAAPEVVVDGVTGVVCDDPDELAAGVRAARSLDPSACREHVRRTFSIASMVDGYVSAYRGAIAARQRPPATLVPSVLPGAERVQAG
jgi:glycosyltransferase involved in cell wall biosynthesis